MKKFHIVRIHDYMDMYPEVSYRQFENEEKANAYQKEEQCVKALENRIACFLQELNLLEQHAVVAKQELDEKSQEYIVQISRIVYEKLSMEIHKLLDDLRLKTSNLEMIQAEMDVLEEEMQQVEKIIHLYQCAKQQITVDEQKEEYEFLAQKIDVFRKSEEELEPERRRIGGYLKGYYQEKIADAKATLEQKEAEYEEKEQQWQQQKEIEKQCQSCVEELLKVIAACEARIKGFDQREDEFNRNFRETFTRNILGDYEPGMLAIKREQYEKQQTELTRNCTQHVRQREEAQERKRICERNREDKQNERQGKKLELRILQNESQDFENQVRERQTIMRYLEVEDSMLWQFDKVLEAAERKLSEIDRSRKLLEQEENELQKEWKKLTSGEVLELPQDFKDLLTELELHPVYGMNWLEKNGYSVQENTRLVRKQPFLPYSLILSSIACFVFKGIGYERGLNK